MDALLAIRFDFDTVGDFLFDPIILRAMRETLYIALFAMVLGIGLGIVLAVMRESRNPIVSAPAGV
jgi:polar amino acid transport system permease protein